MFTWFCFRCILEVICIGSYLYITCSYLIIFATADGLLIIQRHPQNQIVKSNQTVVFECFVNGSRTSLTVTWERNRIQHNSRNIGNTIHSNGVSSSLRIDRATADDGGKYRCNATSAGGNSAVSTEAELIS